LIERFPSEAARSSAPTWSTLRTPRMSDPRCVSESAIAMGRLCDAIRGTNGTVGVDPPAA
jgi:hypothetical protein